MAEEKEKRVKCLILRRGRGAVLDGQGRQEAANLLIAKLSGRSATNECLEPSDPKAVGFKGPVGIIPQLNCTFQVAVFPFPGGCGWT